MRNSQCDIQLPYSVESLLAELSAKNNIDPAQNAARERLAGLGEQAALNLLRNISDFPIRNLTGFIIHKAKEFAAPSPPFPRSPGHSVMVGFQPPLQGYDKGSPISLSVSGGSVTCSSPCSSRAATESEWETVVSHLPDTEPELETLVSHPNFDEPCCDGRRGDEVSDAGATVCHPFNDLYPIRGESRQTYMDDNWNYSMRTKDSIATKTFKRPVFTEHLKALGKLDFPKAFLVLSAVTPYALEEVLSVDCINDLQDLPMAAVESAVESNLRKALAIKSDSVFHFESKKYDWDPNKVYEYHCHVDREGNCVFKRPALANTRTHLQRVLGDSNVLQVHFAELLPEEVEQNEKKQYGCYKYKPTMEERNTYHRLAKEGIFVGLRRYQFFVFKDGDKQRKKNPMSSSVKCYFVCTKSFAEVDKESPYILFNKSIDEARCLFMHVHTVANLKKYIARFTLILSKTIPFGGDISDVTFTPIADIPCLDNNKKEVYDLNGERLIHTDGTGFISEDLASQCPKNVIQGKHLSNQISEASPLLIQCRLFYDGDAVKGTLLVNRTLPPKSIHVRESMIKVERDKNYVGCEPINSVEIIGTSSAISVAFESWLVFMDRLLTPEVADVKECETLKEKMQKLTNIYYQALDAPKTGQKVEVPKDLQPKKRPHFLSKKPEDINLDKDKFYKSASVLGKIYDLTSSYDGVESDEIWTIPCFQDAEVRELRTLWHQRYAQYRRDMARALNGTDSSNNSLRAKSVIQKYKQILYEAASLDESKKQRQRIHDEACAIYQVVYKYAKENKDTKKCLFAWRVAGEALCEIYFRNQRKQPILISPSLLYDILS